MPGSYLQRWEDQGQIRVTDVNARKTYMTAAKNAARETDYYRVESPDVDPTVVPPLFFETMLSRVEGMCKQAIDELLIHQPWESNPELMAQLTWFLSFQYTRGEGHRQMQRDMVAKMFRTMYSDVSDEGIRALLGKLGRSPTADALREMREVIDEIRNGTIVAQPQDAMLIGNAASVAGEIGQHLLSREWIVYQTPPILVTSDEPVVTVGGPGYPRGERAGIGKAGVIVFPLSPCAVLVMFRPDIAPLRPAERPQLDHIETAELNRDIIANAARWAFERPSRRATLGIRVPLTPSPTAYEDIRLSVESGRDVQAIRGYRPTRWANTDHPPDWPVSQWWHALRR